jgi:uncharacterized protein YndB with AHSA1/START domain
MSRLTDAAARAGIAPFEISREFDAPRELVWEVFTTAEHLIHWWSPKGFGIRGNSVDLEPGGMFHYGLATPDGKPFWGRFVYREIVPTERLVYVVSFSDEYGGVARHIFQGVWPLEILSETLFEDLGGRTRLTIRWVPINASPAEIEAFDEGRASMTGGFTGTLDQLEDYLKALDRTR